ncbi:MAG: hypothetical protein OEZ51_15380, partial [Nitrospinota bacterium]|nr:hypothetical protein [Nitrospinota bacterium]
GRTEIVDLDGLKGFIHIINVLGEKLINDEDFYLFGQVSEMFSEEEVKECLSLAGETNPIIKKYYDAVMEFNGKGKEEDIPDSNELSLEEVFNIIDRTKDRNRNFELRSFGRKAKIFEIEQVLGRLLKEDEKFKKLACLEVFTDRAFPSLELGLFDLLQVEDKDIRYNSIWAMSNVEDKKVREFAVNYLNAKGKKCDPSMLKLLENNYQPGDHKLIESVLKDWDDPDDNHEAVLNLLRINDKKERPELAGGFLWAYDHTPCSHCRGSIVESLVDWEEAPVLMLEECLMDCQEDTVELAKSSFE